MTTLKIKEKLARIVEIISEKKAKDIVILDVHNFSGLCDYFIICSGDSTRQVKAIHEETIRSCKEGDMRAQHSEANESSYWVLVDFFDIILHIFTDEAREYYNLERLWDKAKKVTVKIPRKIKAQPKKPH
ncbi:MAG: ribosome silencing factor [Candidatus Omnitrophica bacterium]|nr:ribosome silencing factor [Candidatus Omnitrophota bacterium]